MQSSVRLPPCPELMCAPQRRLFWTYGSHVSMYRTRSTLTGDRISKAHSCMSFVRYLTLTVSGPWSITHKGMGLSREQTVPSRTYWKHSLIWMPREVGTSSQVTVYRVSGYCKGVDRTEAALHATRLWDTCPCGHRQSTSRSLRFSGSRLRHSNESKVHTMPPASSPTSAPSHIICCLRSPIQGILWTPTGWSDCN